MADPETGIVSWYSPDPRGVFPLDPPEAFRVPRNLEREVRKGKFVIRSDAAFEQVIRQCSRPRSDDNQSWLNEQMIGTYVRLHEMGHAHSVEAWLEDHLVGGLYGVHIGKAFFGESMFSRPEEGGSNASKICLVHLVRRLRERGFALLDTQFWNPHLDQFGCVEIPAADYERQLSLAVRADASW